MKPDENWLNPGRRLKESREQIRIEQNKDLRKG